MKNPTNPNITIVNIPAKMDCENASTINPSDTRIMTSAVNIFDIVLFIMILFLNNCEALSPDVTSHIPIRYNWYGSTFVGHLPSQSLFDLIFK
jgi:hypothetical protein